jgi:fatty acid synthase subunit beta
MRTCGTSDVTRGQEKATNLALQAKLDSINREHGDTYIKGIQPRFDILKARHFDSSWNWVRQDSLLMYYDINFGRLTTVDREITARCIALLNRADPTHKSLRCFEGGRLAKEFGQKLIDNTREVVGKSPVYKDSAFPQCIVLHMFITDLFFFGLKVTFPAAPHTEVTEKGEIKYSEVVRENVWKLEAYVEEMASGDTVSGSVNIQKVQDDVLKLWSVVKALPEISSDQKNHIKSLYEGVVRSLHNNPDPSPRTPRSRHSSSQLLRPQVTGVTAVTSLSSDKTPLLHLKRKVGNTWEYSSNLTGVYLDILHEIATLGTTFKDKNALLAGVGKGSIGVEIVKGLFSGGAHVVITTPSYSHKTVEYYQESIFQSFGSRSFQPGLEEALVDYIYYFIPTFLNTLSPTLFT